MDHFTLFFTQMKETIQATITWDALMQMPICFVIGIFSFLFGIQNDSILVALVMLVAFDTVMGIGAAYAEGKPIESRRALKAASKLTVYGILCSSAFFTEKAVPGTTLIDTAMISFLALTELISIMENAGRMGFAVPQKLLNRLNEARMTIK